MIRKSHALQSLTSYSSSTPQPTNGYFAPKARVWDLQAQHLALHGKQQKRIRFKDLQKIPANTSYDGVSTCIKNQQHSRAIIVVL